MGKKIGYQVTCVGKSANLVKLYDNYEDAMMHFEQMCTRGFAQSVEMHRISFEVLGSIHKATAEEYRSDDWHGVPPVPATDPIDAAEGADVGVVDEPVPGAPTDN